MSGVKLCIYLILSICVAVSYSQIKPVASLKTDLCAKRIQHAVFRDARNISHAYFFSWDYHVTRDQKLTWSEAREICRLHCMDTVSLETSGENDYIQGKIKQANRDFIWTSGRKCNFGKTCDRVEYQPIIENGWFWAGSGVRLGRTGNRNNGDWSNKGAASGRPQPDNHADSVNGIDEGCLMLSLDAAYGIGWHDERCDYRRSYVCEDSDELLERHREGN